MPVAEEHQLDDHDELLLRQGAADIVRAARQCDIQVKGLQDVIRSDRKTTGDTP